MNSSDEGLSERTLFILTDQGFATGIGNYALELAKLMKPVVPNIRLVSLCSGPTDWLDNAWVPTGTRTVSDWWRIILVASKNYRTFLERVGPLAQVHFCGANYEFVRKFKNPVVTIHDYYVRLPTRESFKDPRMFGRDLAALWTYLTLPRRAQNASSVIVPSAYVRRCLQSRANVNSAVIHHWIDSTRFLHRPRDEARKKLGFETGATLLLNVSTGASNKNLGVLGRIADRLPPGYKLVKLGARVSNYSGRVVHVNRLDSGLYPQLFNACDAYLHLSTEEGFGYPLLESLSSGLPVIAIDTPLTREVLGNAAIFVPHDASVTEWLAHILRSTDRLTLETVSRLSKAQLLTYDSSRAREAYRHLYADTFNL